MLRRRRILMKVRDWLLANPDALHYLLENFGYFKSPYVRGGEDANRETHVNIGKQMAGETLVNISQLTPQQLQVIRAQEVSATQDREEVFEDD